ncbi:MAG: sigma-70 family RNA polymerase sigma factor [Planctomycetaceae bacterium]|nr:sigma-70 family RNA polymerase sigma factor [Planctomycetaceae bacterium]
MVRAPSEEFVQQFTRHQRRLYLYILSQVSNTQDAEEVLQETNLIVWAKFHQFDLTTNFFAWAAQIATYEVLKFRQRRHREKLRFSDEFVDAVSRDVMERSEELERRRTALEMCLKKLKPDDRALIHRRYQPGERGKHVAADLGRPANSVYQSLGRIRRTLLDCIQRRLATEATA